MRNVLIFFLLFFFAVVKSQGILEYEFDGTEQGKSLLAVLEEIERKTNARFYFLPEWIESVVFRQTVGGQTLGEVFNDLFSGSNLWYIAMDQYTVIIVKDPTQALVWKNAIELALRRKEKVEQYKFGELGKLDKGRQVTIAGQVIDSETGQPIPFANIRVGHTQDGTTTDKNGDYSLSITPGVNVLSFSFIDYDNKIIDLEAYQDAELNLKMEKSFTLLEEVVIEGRGIQELTTSRIGQNQLNMKEIKRAPAFLGEVDLVKQVQMLPGVTTVGEAASGFNVRGGSVDQNLILYDGLPIFNSSHVFGFLSAFNPETIRDVSFYRGGIPAKYGGRVSSVLDIQSSDGNYEEWKVKAGIGMITSNLSLSGPIKKEKTAMVASLRSTYSNWLVRSVRSNFADLSKSSVFFYDGNLKLTHLLDNETKVSFSGYSSKDRFTLVGDSTFQWNNVLLSAKLDHQFSEKLGSEFTIGSSIYNYSVLNKDNLTAFELSYQITSSVVKAGFFYQKGEHNLKFGLQLLHYGFRPGSLKPTSPRSNAKRITLDKQYSIESGLYITDEWQLNKLISVEAGIRIPMFVSFGAADVNTYEDNGPREIETVLDTLRFARGEVIKSYFGLEPRLSIRRMLNRTSSLKFGYHRAYQYLHLVTNTTSVTPVDIWQPSGYYLKPQRADQVSLGYFKDFGGKDYGASIEAFYKRVNNILDFKDGAQLILNEHLETDLLQGKGRSHGIETSFFKNMGRLSGSLNYTYSRSFRLIEGPSSSESINEGKEYPSSFDQPHIANLSWKYGLSKRHFFTGNFTYHVGRPVTIPLSAFSLENTTVAYFSERNQFRIPDYHRLDIALVIEGNHKRNKWWDGTWVISVYNVYGRRNPYSIFFKNSDAGVLRPFQLSIVGVLFPSISYKLEF